MPSPDLSKLTLHTGYNAFKNVNQYSGSVIFPTSLTAGQVATVTSVITLSDTPVFTDYSANFVETVDATFGSATSRWYSGNVAGNFDIGINVVTPLINAGYINCGLYPIVSGTIVTMTGSIINPYGTTITLAPLTVPFLFVEYTLAS